MEIDDADPGQDAEMHFAPMGSDIPIAKNFLESSPGAKKRKIDQENEQRPTKRRKLDIPPSDTDWPARSDERVDEFDAPRLRRRINEPPPGYQKRRLRRQIRQE